MKKLILGLLALNSISAFAIYEKGIIKNLKCIEKIIEKKHACSDGVSYAEENLNNLLSSYYPEDVKKNLDSCKKFIKMNKSVKNCNADDAINKSKYESYFSKITDQKPECTHASIHVNAGIIAVADVGLGGGICTTALGKRWLDFSPELAVGLGIGAQVAVTVVKDERNNENFIDVNGVENSSAGFIVVSTAMNGLLDVERETIGVGVGTAKTFGVSPKLKILPLKRNWLATFEILGINL